MKVIKNYLYNASYQLLAIIVPLVTAPYISRVLHASGVGINAYTNSIIQYFILLAQLGITLYGSKQIASVRNDKKALSKNFWEIQLVKTITTLIAVILLIIFIIIYPRYQVYMLIQIINVIAVAFDVSWFFSGLEDFKKIVLRNTFIRLLSVVLIFGLIRKANQTWLYILILSISTLLGNITLWPYLRPQIKKINFDDLNLLIHLSALISLFIPTLATTVYMQLNKTMLGSMCGADYSGYYYNSDQLIRAVLTLATSLGTVMLPHVAAAYSKGDKRRVKAMLYTSFDFISLVCVPMFFGLAGIAIKLGPFFYGKGFSIVGIAMFLESPIIVLIGWNNTTGNQYLVPTGKNKVFSHSVIYGAIFNILANIPMIYFFNIYGAMIVTVLSEAFVSIYQIIAIRQEIKCKYLFKNMPKYMLAGFLMFIPVFLLNQKLSAHIWTFTLEIVVGIVIYSILIILLRTTSLELIENFLKKENSNQ